MKLCTNLTQAISVSIMRIFVIIITVFFTLELFSIYSFSTALEKNIKRSVLCRTIENADFTMREIEAFKKCIQGVALRSELQSMNWEDQSAILAYECTRLDVERFEVTTLNGLTRSTAGGAYDISEEEYFKRAKMGDMVFTDPYQNTIDGHTVIICAVPIYSRSREIVGVLSAVLDAEFLSRVIENKKIETNGYGFIVNREGMIIAHPKVNALLDEKFNILNKAEELGYVELAALGKKIVQGEIGYGFYRYEGNEKFMAFVPMSNTGWSLVLTVPKREVFNEIDALKNKFVLLMLLSVLITILSGIVFLRYRTQYKKMESLQEDVSKSEKMLLESIELDRVKTDFFANISHELKTPLNVILGTLQLFNLYISSPAPLDKSSIAKHLRSMKQNCLRLIRLVNNLIDTTKIDAGFFKANLKNYNIISVVEEITLSVADYIKDKGIYLQFDTEVEEKIIACDADKIERIMLNLLSNAVKFTNDGGCISVMIYDKGDLLAISVKDTGIGIPDDKKELIFERFRQVDKSLVRNSEGSGIGLSLVKSLVEMHGGRISVISELGKGSEFIIEMPVRTVSDMSYVQSDKVLSEQKHTIERVNVEFSDIYSE